MAYGRRYRKRYARKRGSGFMRKASGYVKQANSAYSLAKSAWSGVKMLKSLVNVEKKKFDIEQTATNVTSTGSIYPLCAIAQGDTDQTRNGNSVLCQSLLIRGYWKQDNLIAGVCRYLILMDMQQVADTAPAVTDILDPSFTNLYSAPLNNLTVGRFKVLYDRRFTTATAGPQFFAIKNYIPLTGHHLRYNGTAGTDVQKGQLYLLVISDRSASNYPTIEFVSRLTFTDN